MCKIFAGQDPRRYESETRSVRLNGFSTSVRLEAAFWSILEEIAAAQGLGLTRFLAILHDEATEIQGEVKNFASLLRCSCLIYLSERGDPARVAFAKGALIAAE